MTRTNKTLPIAITAVVMLLLAATVTALAGKPQPPPPAAYAFVTQRNCSKTVHRCELRRCCRIVSVSTEGERAESIVRPKGRDPDLGGDLAIKVLLDQHKDKPEVIALTISN